VTGEHDHGRVVADAREDLSDLGARSHAYTARTGSPIAAATAGS
jgi:hypothetical protein